MLNLIGYTTSKETAAPAGQLYQYVTAGNGVFLRAARTGLEIQLPLATFPVRGLPELERKVSMARVPASILALMLHASRLASPNEILFYLRWSQESGWSLETPEQVSTSHSVHPVDPLAGEGVLMEVHSHNNMKAFFSVMDDREEAQGFRIYAVLGRVNTRPEIQCRIGVYGQFLYISPSEVFDEDLAETVPMDFQIEEAEAVEPETEEVLWT